MTTTIQRVWRQLFATLFLTITVVACGKKADPSHNPDVVDSVTIDYISNSLKSDLLAAEPAIASIDKVKLTRQDNIPIALVDIVYHDGSTTRDFYCFEYQTISNVRDLMEQNAEMTVEQIAERLSLAPSYVVMLKSIVLQAKNYKER